MTHSSFFIIFSNMLICTCVTCERNNFTKVRAMTGNFLWVVDERWKYVKFCLLGYSWGERQDLEMSPDVIGYPINGPCPQQTSYNCNLNIWTGGLREHVYVSVCKLHFFDEKFLTQPHDLIRALRILGKAQPKTFVSKSDFKLMDY